ncbi:hypothetical protein EAS64_06865 [Trebonia kvetii]|uniref:Acyl-CoA dehydrogenase/oxidase N-terminal domain-containing protein n=1 Tax=Trebonia kvetii TaxID=2480626 RepID=A0A6P2C6I1_9ACTN|nr:hypothetical protein EAS64_06865 [Trebonia kvetii]
MASDTGTASDSGRASAELIAAIRARRAEFTAAGDRAEAERNLPADTMETLRDLGAFWLKTPAELGGTPLDPLDFCDVLEEFALTDTATAWAVMVGNGGTGTAGDWLPDAGDLGGRPGRRGAAAHAHRPDRRLGVRRRDLRGSDQQPVQVRRRPFPRAVGAYAAPAA